MIDRGGGRAARRARRDGLVAVVACAALAFLVACAAPSREGSSVVASGVADRSDDSPSSLPIAVELVSVLVQLEGRSPYDTTLQVNAASTAFGRHLAEALRIAGYGLQTVSDDQGRNYLAYSAATRSTEIGRAATFEIRLGALSIARRMTVANGAWVPVGPVTIRGSAPQPVALNGSIHVERIDRPLSYPSGVRFVADATGETIVETLYRYAYWPTGAARAGSSGAELSALDPRRFLEQATGRLYEGGSTALALRPATDFGARQSLELRFPTASARTLGADNRRALERLETFVAPGTDRLTIASCERAGARTGASAGADTDDSAARSARVKAELLTLGVPGDQVLELGCPVEPDRRPSAGRDVAVVVERLNR